MPTPPPSPSPSSPPPNKNVMLNLAGWSVYSAAGDGSDPTLQDAPGRVNLIGNDAPWDINVSIAFE